MIFCSGLPDGAAALGGGGEEDGEEDEDGGEDEFAAFADDPAAEGEVGGPKGEVEGFAGGAVPVDLEFFAGAGGGEFAEPGGFESVDVGLDEFEGIGEGFGAFEHAFDVLEVEAGDERDDPHEHYDEQAFGPAEEGGFFLGHGGVS